MPRPRGVTAIAGIFFLAAAYLLVIALTLLLAPGAVSMMLGSPLLGGLELAGPYMFLLVSAVGAVIAAGLWRLRNWARWSVIAAALLGIVMLMPAVSSAVTGDQPATLFSSALGVIVRVIVVWYLFQPPVADAFSRRGESSSL